MKTLLISLEVEEQRKEKARLEIEFTKEKHNLEKELLLVQISNFTNGTILIAESTNKSTEETN